MSAVAEKPGTKRAASRAVPGAQQPQTRRAVQEDVPPAGLNHAQLVRILNHIAATANLLDNLLTDVSMFSGLPSQVQNLVESSIYITRGLGAIADEAAQSHVVGGLNEWHLGPNFCMLSKERAV